MEIQTKFAHIRRIRFGFRKRVLLGSEKYLPAVKWRWVPAPLSDFVDRDSYGTFLSTISGIGGVLIGLYYAACGW
jgi:hypothetical protein